MHKKMQTLENNFSGLIAYRKEYKNEYAIFNLGTYCP